MLNKPAYRKATILVAGENFGCGSSREHAPWALLDFGIRCVIAPDFADIFYNNCFKNGILPIKLPQAEVDKLMDDASRGANATLTVDLEKQEIRGPDGGVIKFDIDPFRKHCLLERPGRHRADAGEEQSIETSKRRLRHAALALGLAPAGRTEANWGKEAHMAKPIHMMVRVKEEARSVDFYRKAFGLEIADRVDFPDFTLDLHARQGVAFRGGAHRQQGPRRALQPR